jgi:hypothetical protein
LSPDNSKILALVTLSAAEEAVLYLRPDWRSVAEPRDHEYLESIFRDFENRLRTDPGVLFRQISKLSVGPIVTKVVGFVSIDDSSVESLLHQFMVK